jgi:hypothetical protein
MSAGQSRALPWRSECTSSREFNGRQVTEAIQHALHMVTRPLVSSPANSFAARAEIEGVSRVWQRSVSRHLLFLDDALLRVHALDWNACQPSGKLCERPFQKIRGHGSRSHPTCLSWEAQPRDRRLQKRNPADHVQPQMRLDSSFIRSEGGV